MKNYLLYILIFAGAYLNAQSNNFSKINSGGSSNGSISFSIGEGIQGSYLSNDLNQNVGFQSILLRGRTNTLFDNIPPQVTLTDTDDDNILSFSDVVTITAAFSESMIQFPTISIEGTDIYKNPLMPIYDFNKILQNFIKFLLF